jgi:hypothetical protein
MDAKIASRARRLLSPATLAIARQASSNVDSSVVTSAPMAIKRVTVAYLNRLTLSHRSKVQVPRTRFESTETSKGRWRTYTKDHAEVMDGSGHVDFGCGASLGHLFDRATPHLPLSPSTVRKTRTSLSIPSGRINRRNCRSAGTPW